MHLKKVQYSLTYDIFGEQITGISISYILNISGPSSINEFHNNIQSNILGNIQVNGILTLIKQTKTGPS